MAEQDTLRDDELEEKTSAEETAEDPEEIEETDETDLDEDDEAAEDDEEPEEDVNEVLEQERERYLRLFAEFDNFRKRTAKEKLEAYSDATARCIGELLPVVDNF